MDAVDAIENVELNVCSHHRAEHDFMNLRIAAIFIVLVGSTTGALFPVLARRSTWLQVPKSVFDFAKYFGSGVIIATAFIHLLAPALEALGSECLSDGWKEYPYALALCMLSIFSIFVIELVAFRWGTTKLAKLGKSHDSHGHGLGAHASHGPEGLPSKTEKTVDSDVESAQDTHESHSHGPRSWSTDTTTQIIGVGILEFGVILHSILIGLTLAVDEDFKILFIVVVFHQTFEGLGLGSRLAYMDLAAKYHWIPVFAAVLYGFTTPLGIAIGLGVRHSYNPASTTASIVSGVLDALSSGILVYTGLVELFAHEFLFNKEMMAASNAKLAYAVGSMMLGAGVMALLGKWA
ncbi:hypothetical protein D9611_006357 [Ephemerocybe angulata]|uniref:ZIP-like iron-zinc transporter n=1 Tax=Ephemerocybe angulata TaxID=980116 RepID=A0A8H5FGX8_9AGAR|nr:hypothetical protein D9611_006357 [Tulosesus angulatus]